MAQDLNARIETRGEVETYIAQLQYALDNGAFAIHVGESDFGGGLWWLRSPGYLQSSAAFVDDGGYVNEESETVDDSDYAVRPSLWIDPYS